MKAATMKAVFFFKRYARPFMYGLVIASVAVLAWEHYRPNAFKAAFMALAKAETSRVCLFTPYTLADKIYASCNLQKPDKTPFDTLSRIGSVGEHENALVWCSGNAVEIHFTGRVSDTPFCITR